MARAEGERAIGVSTVVFDHLPVAEAVTALAALGVTHVEPAFIGGFSPFAEADLSPAFGAQLRRAAESGGASLHSMSLHCDLGAPDGAEMLARRLKFAAEAGARFVITNTSRKQNADAVRRVVEGALPELERRDLVLALENPGHGSDALTGDPADLTALARSFASPHACGNLDLCNGYTFSRGTLGLGAMRDDLLAAGSVHLKDVAAVGGGWAFCAVGAGMVGYAGSDLALPDVPVILELPLGLYRPGRGDPVRRPAPPSHAERVEAVLASLEVARKVVGRWRRSGGD